MALWCLKGGRTGEREQRMLDNSVLAIGWEQLGNLSNCVSKEELYTLYQEKNPEASTRRANNHVGQIWAFIKRLVKEDLVVVPLKTQSVIAIGEITSNYYFDTQGSLGEDMKHLRKVNWLATDIPRTYFNQDLLYSFGAFMTVCQVKRNDAEQRVKNVLRGVVEDNDGQTDAEEEPEHFNIEQIAQDQLLKYVGQKFRGHELSRLVEAILIAQGMTAERMNPGPDGGVDILAGYGAMGFDSPRICVQVKSSDTPVGVDILRALIGTMESFGSDQGLLVSWGGFKSSTYKEALKSYFRVRLWDSGDLLNSIIHNYEKLPDSIQAEIPLKRVYTLALEEE